jgi:hypothetical protein
LRHGGKSRGIVAPPAHGAFAGRSEAIRGRAQKNRRCDRSFAGSGARRIMRAGAHHRPSVRLSIPTTSAFSADLCLAPSRVYFTSAALGGEHTVTLALLRSCQEKRPGQACAFRCACRYMERKVRAPHVSNRHSSPVQKDVFYGSRAIDPPHCLLLSILAAELLRLQLFSVMCVRAPNRARNKSRRSLQDGRLSEIRRRRRRASRLRQEPRDGLL